jgi:UDP-N-acetylglucosamine 1-carboxyvinyltransferase
VEKLRIEGGRRLRGEVAIAGAKNAALPDLAAALLTEGAIRYGNVPALRDVRTMMRVLEQLGADVEAEDAGTHRIRVGRIASFEAPYDLVKTMRASVLVLGPLLARHGHARVSLPGGCAIGERPIDVHLDGLRRMGADVRLEHGYVEARSDRLRAVRFTFPKVTVTGTENLVMAACLADGTSEFLNCAKEPEVVDLADLLNAMGASVHGAGTDRIVVEGRPALGEAAHDVIPDRIEAGTYLVAGAIAGDGVTVLGCRPDDLAPVLDKLRAVGVGLDVGSDRIHVRSSPELVAADLRTEPHPGFPTDMQAQYMTMMTRARGTALITETIFERRFMHVGELRRMGADIRIEGNGAVVVGPTPLTGAQVMATDLRASACLVLAGLVADGVTVIDRVYHLDRGYEPMERKLTALGASVERVR